MIFTILTPLGSKIELDPQKIEAVEVAIDGIRYEISIKEL